VRIFHCLAWCLAVGAPLGGSEPPAAWDGRGGLLSSTLSAPPASPDSFVLDDTGRRLSTAEPRIRVVSLVPALTDIVVELGGSASLAGRTRFDADARIAHVPSMGGALDPSLEAIVQARPDLVIVWADTDSRGVAERLESLGLPVYGAVVGSIDDVRRHTRALGSLLGRGDAAEKLMRRIEAGLHAARPPEPFADPPVVLVVLWPRPIMTSGRGTFIDELIRLVGARGAFDDLDVAWPTVSFEAVLQRDPDLILLAMDDPEEYRGSMGWIDDSSFWGTLRAVKAGRVHLVDADTFTRPGPAMVHAAAELARHVRALGNDR